MLLWSRYYQGPVSYTHLDVYKRQGTDSLSSNLQLSMVKEIHCIQGHFPHIPLEEILKWCCLNGACAVGAEKRFGSFTPGKKPGIVLIDNINWEKMELTKESKSRRII